ncbi:MAG: undecaprenyl-diphosphatase UppP [Bryobacter sp.]
MPITQAVVLAIVQGFTEFLPISSSAHLFLVPWLLGWPDQGLDFDIALHIGTLIAVLIYFFRDWLQVTGHALGQKWGNNEELAQAPKLFWYLVVASLPAGVVGLLLKDWIETQLRSPFVMGTTLIVVGVLLYCGERVGSRSRHIGQTTLADSFLIGCSQALALIPGTSRSGITITTGLLRGMTRGAAARFSFLLSTPIIAASGMKSVYDLSKQGLSAEMLTPFLVGIVVSAITGLAVITFFLNYLKKRSLNLFVAYRIFFGILIIALAVVRSRG